MYRFFWNCAYDIEAARTSFFKKTSVLNQDVLGFLVSRSEKKRKDETTTALLKTEKKHIQDKLVIYS